MPNASSKVQIHTLPSPQLRDKYALFKSDALAFLDRCPSKPIFDLVVTSPPYNIGKPYEGRRELEEYKQEQQKVIERLVARLKPKGSICWQVGNYVSNGKSRGMVYPLDLLFHPIFERLGLQLRNRIVWKFGHGLHCKHRFSGRYEVILWYTKSESYEFNLDAVRIPSKYPGKRHYKGPNAGKPSCNPKGKNPEDVWEDVWSIPNVKSNHVEKTIHPCQFPVGLVERLVLALTRKNALVFDPFAGVCSSGVAAAIHKRRFWGCDRDGTYLRIGAERIDAALNGNARFRPHDVPVYDHRLSPLSHPSPLID